MPKQHLISVQLAPERYDRCKDCPLCCLIPENERPEGFKYGCLGLMVTVSDDDFEGKTKSRKCDDRWSMMASLTNRIYRMPEFIYQKYRLPFEQSKRNELC